MKKLMLFFILLLSFISISCDFADYDLTETFYRIMNVELRATNLKNLDNEAIVKSIQPGEKYDVLIITDLHYGMENRKGNGPRRDDEWFDAITQKDAHGKAIVDNVKFVICMGDVADHGFRKEFDNYKKNILDVLKTIKTAKAPDGLDVYNIVGNHDLYHTGWPLWAEYCYPGTSFYRFQTPSFNWYFIDSASGSLGTYQYDALKDHMKKADKKNIVFSHVPLYAEDFPFFVMQDTEERNKIINTCAKYKTQAFIDGHTHRFHESDMGSFTELNLPGFLYKYGYAVLHIDEANQSCSLEVKYY